ncbi:dihydroorotate dehydrogenase electron transfer subunit [Erysipelotrichaceae bacterium HCN-30851]
MQEERGLILSNQKIAKDTYRMEIQANIAKDMKPGQFVNVQVEGYMLRRPISICSVEGKNSFVIIYKVVGDGTKKLSTMRRQEIIDVFGPLGSSYPIHEEENEVLLIGGGVGVPPLYELAKQYRKLGTKVYVVLGFNDSDSIFYENEFERLGCEVVIATMDGSYGVKGTVIDAIDARNITCDFTCSCGPRPMLKAVEARYTRGYMSFESRMACGIGACMACVAKDKKEENMYHRICKEGPVFPIGKVEY